jgi:dephospho-CoA kinase
VETRVRRLTTSRGMAQADARARVAAQAGDDERRRAADVWLDNEGSPEELEKDVDRLWSDRLVPFERNLRAGERSRRLGGIHLVDGDPAWPQQAARLLERLRRVWGDVAVTLDHVGSTAVDGLVAKDVIDLQVGVPSLDVADDPAVLERLRAAGFPRAEEIRSDNARASQGSWPKRMHGNADPGRVTHVHVRAVGSPGWRWALLFRDWMRADGAARAEYAAEKRRIAATGATVGEYAEAKEPWFSRVHDRAERWATTTGWQPGQGD